MASASSDLFVLDSTISENLCKSNFSLNNAISVSFAEIVAFINCICASISCACPWRWATVALNW